MRQGTIAIVGIAAFIGIFGLGVAKTMARETVQAVITDKERVTTGTGDNMSSKYLVFTDGEVFENTDSLLMMKWDSSDVQGRIAPGASCRLDVYGWRIPFLSMYRNIHRATCEARHD